MIDTPRPVCAIDGDGIGQAPRGLPEQATLVVAQEVIRRLAVWKDQAALTRKAILDQREEPDVAALCDALVGLDPGAARAMVLRAHSEGATHPELCIYHVAAAAHRLGEMWDSDRINSADMALAAGRMLVILRDLRDLYPPGSPTRGRCALFAAVPGETHVLGVTMAVDLFREDGWDVDLWLGKDEAALVDRVRANGYPIVGLSAATIGCVHDLARVIVALRVTDPKILIFIGGHIAALDPDIAQRVGADGAAADMDGCKSELARLHAMLGAG